MKRLFPVLLCLLGGKPALAAVAETPQQELARVEVLERNHKHDEALALARKAAEAGLAEAWYWIAMHTTDAYRDAWAAFATVRYPGTTGERWKAWATSERVVQLRALAGEEE